jgi:hypothetical protein
VEFLPDGSIWIDTDTFTMEVSADAPAVADALAVDDLESLLEDLGAAHASTSGPRVSIP